MRALNYPELAKRPLAGQLCAGAHTDYGSLTLLSMQGAPGGLEVHRGGDDWEAVSAPSSALVVNIADLMQQWTNDVWRSTLHRVALPPPDARGARRQSLVFFHQPNYDREIAPIPACSSPGSPVTSMPTTPPTSALRGSGPTAAAGIFERRAGTRAPRSRRPPSAFPASRTGRGRSGGVPDRRRRSWRRSLPTGGVA
ncbi:2OG-Fe(II) oxygenase family protein [Sorangium sp. So ce117]|uniref:2OG-Fe(II) oxygenase family protein n=1 Tax=Sorangium sp. So ce117 TaxID=3133277 RepID=UPI003F60C518